MSVYSKLLAYRARQLAAGVRVASAYHLPADEFRRLLLELKEKAGLKPEGVETLTLSGMLVTSYPEVTPGPGPSEHDKLRMRYFGLNEWWMGNSRPEDHLPQDEDYRMENLKRKARA